jgi:hypothetical protein
MIDKIKNSPMLTDPWEHKVVDDFLPDSAYLKIREAAKFLTKYTIDGKTNPIWINEALTLGVSKDTVEEIINVTDEILDNINEIVKDFTTVNKSLQGSSPFLPSLCHTQIWSQWQRLCVSNTH